MPRMDSEWFFSDTALSGATFSTHQGVWLAITNRIFREAKLHCSRSMSVTA